MQRNALALLAAVAVSLVSMHLGTTAAMARVHSFPVESEQRGVLTFNIHGVDASRIRSATVRAPRRQALKIGRRTVQRAARRGVLRVKVSRRWLAPDNQSPGARLRAARHRRAAHKLRVVTDTTPPATTTGTTNPPAAGQAAADQATAITTAVGAPILSDAAAAAPVSRSSFEPRARNAQANQRVPSASELIRFFAFSPNWGPCAEPLKARISGNFTGTTDEIIQWAAHKWGIDVDIVRAVAVKESWWNQDAQGDEDSPGVFMSYGLMQVRRNSPSGVAPNWNGTFPLSRDSTAFNLDYWGASVRQYHDGCATWLHDVGDNGATYAAGDIWGSVGAWYAGRWRNAGARSYINDVKANLANRTWAQPGF